MDPNANLKEMLQIAKNIDNNEIYHEIDPQDVFDLAKLVLSLDNWLRKGGFLPDAWTQNGN